MTKITKTYQINQRVWFSAAPGTVTEIVAGRRGTTLYRATLDSGRVVLTDQFDAEIEFAPAQPIDFSNRDFYGDVERMSARWKE
jgi:hypothetical protein